MKTAIGCALGLLASLLLAGSTVTAKPQSKIFGVEVAAHEIPPVQTFIPANFLEFLQAHVSCFNKLQISPDKFPLFLAGVYPNCPESQCFMHCLASSLKLYCDESGSDIDRHYLQLGLGQDYHCFRQRTEQCLVKNSAPCNDRCEAAYKQELCFLEDYRKYLDANVNALIAAVQVEKTKKTKAVLYGGFTS